MVFRKTRFLPTCFSSPPSGQILFLLAPGYTPSCLPGKAALVWSEKWRGEYDCVASICSAVSDIPQYSQLVLSVCETLQEEVIALFDQTRHSLASGSATEDKDSMETDDYSRPRHKDQRDGVRAHAGKPSVLPVPSANMSRLPACLLCAGPEGWLVTKRVHSLVEKVSNTQLNFREAFEFHVIGPAGERYRRTSNMGFSLNLRTQEKTPFQH